MVNWAISKTNWRTLRELFALQFLSHHQVQNLHSSLHFHTSFNGHYGTGQVLIYCCTATVWPKSYYQGHSHKENTCKTFRNWIIHSSNFVSRSIANSTQNANVVSVKSISWPTDKLSCGSFYFHLYWRWNPPSMFSTNFDILGQKTLLWKNRGVIGF